MRENVPFSLIVAAILVSFWVYYSHPEKTALEKSTKPSAISADEGKEYLNYLGLSRNASQIEGNKAVVRKMIEMDERIKVLEDSVKNRK